jgi:hypothetical protein
MEMLLSRFEQLKLGVAPTDGRVQASRPWRQVTALWREPGDQAAAAEVVGRLR